MRPRTVLISVMLTLLLPSREPTWAEIVRVDFQGVVDSVETGGRFALDGSVDVGSAMTGFYTYDTRTPDQLPAVLCLGSYPLISISMTVGSYTFTHDSLSSESPVFNLDACDLCYHMYSGTPRFEGIVYVDGSPRTYDEITWYYANFTLARLFTSSPEYIPTDALPDVDSFPELSAFDRQRVFRVRFYEPYSPDRGYFDISGELTSLTVIPEPATLLLFALGALSLLNKRKP